MKRFRISTKSTGDVYAIMVQENPETADAIWDALPLEGVANVWGDGAAGRRLHAQDERACACRHHLRDRQ